MKRLLSAGLAGSMLSLVQAKSIWVEGESATDQVIQKNGWYSSVKETELSGGGLLAHWGKRVGSANYAIKVPADGRYALWLRANPVATRIQVRVGDGEWSDLSVREKSHEQINIATDNKPDLRFVAWVNAGVKNLKAGETTVGIRFTSSNNNHGMLDCFCLTPDLDWKPVRTLKPGEELPHWPVPKLSKSNLDEWISFIRPSAEELGWRNIRWHRSLSEAAGEAEKLKRPILLWAMNGHPCGET